DDLLLGNLALRDAGLGAPLLDHLGHFGIGNGAPLGIIFVPSRAGLLAVASEFAQTIFRQRLAHTRLFRVAKFFADTPTDIQPSEVASRHRTHGHAVVVKGLINGLDACTLFHQELGFTPVRAEHAVADKAPAVADQHADL